MIPQSYEQWKNCIEKDCKIRLTKDFARERLTVYTDASDIETQKFISLYGLQHLKNVIHWFSTYISRS
ncbi:MAG: hypothetical protein J0H29_04995 [Sphingobacteriales bacterium]|nr:hypothetical protein [Sphingobacteriales bacterium]OJY86218.1 MAG: hypothetical protein BGP14_17250 [Sphingobacteriales bacterium 44-15]